MDLVVIVDLMSVAYRWYFAMANNPMTHRGLNTSPLHGTMATIILACHKFGTENIVICTDTRGTPTFRHKLISESLLHLPKEERRAKEYKAGRQAAPEDLKASLAHLRPMIEAFNLPLVGLPGWEADDIVGTYARQAERLGLGAIVITGDKDLCQLVSNQVHVLRWEHQGEQLMWTPRIVRQKLGFRNPEHIADWLAIQGDTSDNYDGVLGIGKTGATRLVKQFGDMDEIYSMLPYIKESVRNLLIEQEEAARLSKVIATIVTDLDDKIPALESILRWDRASNSVVDTYLDHYAMNKVSGYYHGQGLPRIGGSGKGKDYRATIVPTKMNEVQTTAEGYMF